MLVFNHHHHYYYHLFILQEHLSLKKYIIDIVVESVALPEPLKDGEERQKNKKKAKKIKARMNSRYP